MVLENSPVLLGESRDFENPAWANQSGFLRADMPIIHPDLGFAIRGIRWCRWRDHERGAEKVRAVS